MANSYNELFGLGTHTVDPALEGWWKMQETTGTTAADSSGKNRHGAIVGMGANPITSPGPNSYLPTAFTFAEGSGRWIDPDYEWNRLSDFTVACWLQLGTATNSGFFGWQNFNNINDRLFIINRHVDNNIYFIHGGEGPSEFLTAPGGVGSGWEFCTYRIKHSSPQSRSIRQNKSNIRYQENAVPASTSRKFFVGGVRDFSPSNSHWSHYGPIANFSLFSRSLTDAEVDEIQDGPEPLVVTNPTLAFGEVVPFTPTTWSGTVGTWNSQNNGTLTYQWELIDYIQQTIVQSGTGSSPGGSGYFSGTYVLRVRASNNGGSDPQQYPVSNFVEVPTLGVGSGTISAVPVLSGTGYTLIEGLRAGYGNVNAVASLVGIKKERLPISPAVLYPIGGWQLPSSGAGGQGLGYGNGGLHMEHVSENIRRIWVSDRGVNTHQLTFDKSAALPWGTPVENWPMATAETMFVSQTQLFDAGLEADNQTYDVCRPNPGGPLLSTGRVFYGSFTESWFGPWMEWIDENNQRSGFLGVPENVNSRPAYGGGFCDIPQWFADEYLDGRNFGVGFGGAISGSGAAGGPTFFAARRPANGDTMLVDTMPLMRFGGPSTAGEFREERFPDYIGALWAPPVTDGVGWWQTDKVMAGPLWIDTPDFSGLCYWSLQGTGQLDYVLQTIGGTEPEGLRLRFYFYSAEKLAEVATGAKLPHEIRGDYYRWPSSIAFDDDGTTPAWNWPNGAHWDPIDEILYLSHFNSSPHPYEPAPAITAYRLSATDISGPSAGVGFGSVRAVGRLAGTGFTLISQSRAGAGNVNAVARAIGAGRITPPPTSLNRPRFRRKQNSQNPGTGLI
jgi:hypothetical protein